MQTIITSDLARIVRGFGIPPHVFACSAPTIFNAVMSRIQEAQEGDTIYTFGERLAPGTLIMEAVSASPAAHIPLSIITTVQGSGLYRADTAEEVRLPSEFPAPHGVRICAVDSFADWVELFVGAAKAPAEAFDLPLSA